jgi:hypothetical protein
VDEVRHLFEVVGDLLLRFRWAVRDSGEPDASSIAFFASARYPLTYCRLFVGLWYEINELDELR